MAEFVKRTRIAASAARVFAFHEEPDAHERLTPVRSGQRIIQATKSLAVGSRAVAEVRIGPVKRILVAEHTAYEAGRMFRGQAGVTSSTPRSRGGSPRAVAGP